jgi:hypothetical protein
VVASPTYPQELVTHKKKEVKAKQVLLECVKDHLIISMEQQNIEKSNTKNNTFIERKQCSLASSRGKPPTEQSSITIILKTKISHASYSYLY